MIKKIALRLLLAFGLFIVILIANLLVFNITAEKANKETLHMFSCIESPYVLISC
jgi:hypothetical protein